MLAQLAQTAGNQTIEIIVMILLSVVLPLLGWTVSRVNQIQRESKDLWEWHRPDQDGRQSWKNADLKKAIEEMVNEIRGLREDLSRRRDD